eukprot:TRINITY_DN3089_c0_g1_i1.p1 TRINITY_DN3089_c0_g1~~TRINITY_DN3089_c0_g1_i1.p1  ORF type:complete len:542 (-),score=164.12 TRINITY_DN3089_c0_g1_i1:71-1696(-)
MTSHRILVSGAASGSDQWVSLVSRIRKIQEKQSQKFDMLLFPSPFNAPKTWDSLNRMLGEALRTFKEFPLPVFYFGLEDILESSSHVEVFKDIRAFGMHGVFQFKNLLIAYWMYENDIKSPENTTQIMTELKEQIREEYGSSHVDILLTRAWPSQLLSNIGSPASLPRDPIDPRRSFERSSSWITSQISSLLCPHYHFVCDSHTFFQRVPYDHPSPLKLPCCRFLSLAPVENSWKQRWLYAFQIKSVNDMTKEEVEEAGIERTPFPFHRKNTRDRSTSDGIREEESDGIHDRKRAKPSFERKRDFGCWFCLGNPKVEKHLIVSIGQHNYMATAKGWLVPWNVLLIPIEHVTDADALSKECTAEIGNYIDALSKMFREKLGESIVVFHRFFVMRGEETHLSIQVVPLPCEKKEAAVSEFQKEAEKHGLLFNEVRFDEGKAGIKEYSHAVDISKALGIARTPHMTVQIGHRGDKDGTACVRFLSCTVKDDQKFPFPLFRDVMSTVFGMPERKNWRSCVPKEEEEKEESKKRRVEFGPYEPSSL